MKKIVLFSVLYLASFVGLLYSQDVTTVEAKNSDISDNLNLEAVASVFGKAKDFEDFEKKLNDPELKLTNLDLNEDGEVDYLRVVETSDKYSHVVAIQAVIGKDQYQDVATIDVVKDENGETQVQVVGDVYMYGLNYIIQPVYVHPPVIFVFFWGPLYHPWHSPYYWGYYPPYYRPWRPYPSYTYRRNVSVNVNVTFRSTNVRINKNTVNLQKKVSRNDYAKLHPEKSFQKRNNGATNKYSLEKNRVNRFESSKVKTGSKSKAKPVNKNHNSKPVAKPTNKKKPVAKSKPAKRPSGSVKTSSKPAVKKKVSKPASRPVKQPVRKGGRR